LFIAQLYRDVTNRIIAEMEQGAVPWTRPWRTRPGTHTGIMPRNAVTGRAYHGINIPILWDAAATHGHQTHAWLTYRQAAERGGQVRKGERGTHVVFTKKLTIKEAETEETKAISMLKTYVVFNVGQVEGLPDAAPDRETPPETRHAAAEAFVAATGADIHHGRDIACFVPSLDVINMPPQAWFRSPENYYATVLHELGHWSGHRSRLDRDLTGRFKSKAYAAEELVAEMTSAFLCAQLSIEGELRHAGYLANWLELLKEDNRAIFTAASKASQAADYLRSFSPPDDEDDQIAG